MTEKHNSSAGKVFSRNMKLFVILVIAALLAISGVTLVIWPQALSTIGAAAGMAATAVFAWAWDKVKTEIKEFRERLKYTEEKADRAEVKAVEEGNRNSKIEATATEASKRADRASNRADTAANTAAVLAVKVDDNSERSRLIEISNEALSKQYADVARIAHNLTDDLQQERIENKAELAELRAQLKALVLQNQQQQAEITELKEAHKREITALHDQITQMGQASTEDKAEITALRARVSELETKVAVLSAENNHLQDENRELRGNTRRMITGQLTGLSPDVEERLNHLEKEKEKQETGGEINP